MDEIENEERFCRICYSEADPVSSGKNLISPCNCKGSLKFVHGSCLKMWRFKGNFLSEIKVCETCNSPYTIVGEKSPHHYIIAISSILFIFFIYFTSTLFFDSIFVAITAIIKDIWFDSSSNRSADNICINTETVYHLSCAMVLITIYKLYSNPTILSVLNYIFTFWRILQFNFTVDKLLFIGFSLFFLKDIYKSVYKKIDRFYFYLLNVQMDSKGI